MPTFVRRRIASLARRWVCAVISACMIPAAPAGASPEEPRRPGECEKATEVLYARRQYNEAADLAIACWDDTELPLFLFRAAKYWKRAKRHAHAIYALKTYIRVATHDNPKRLSDAKSVLRDELRHTGQVVVSVAPALEHTESVTMTLRPNETLEASPPLEYTFSAGDFAEVDLDPGIWNLKVVREGFKDKDEIITVLQSRTPQTISITMEANEPQPFVKPPQPQPPVEHEPPEPPPLPRPPTGLKLGGAVAVGGGSLLLALAIGYAASVGSAERRYVEACEQRDETACYATYRYGKGLNVVQSAGFTAGALMLGAGVAMLAIAARRKRGKTPQGLSLFRMRGGMGISLERRF